MPITSPNENQEDIANSESENGNILLLVGWTDEPTEGPTNIWNNKTYQPVPMAADG